MSVQVVSAGEGSVLCHKGYLSVRLLNNNYPVRKQKNRPTAVNNIIDIMLYRFNYIIAQKL